MDASPATDDGENMMNLNNNSENDDFIDNIDDDDEKNEEDGVWSADIEQSFQEALAIYPPCGRRKIILSDEGKMYGRNELIARYIKLRTGKTRTRKQVSSHIQVLARRRHKDPITDEGQTVSGPNYEDFAYPTSERGNINQNIDTVELAWNGAKAFQEHTNQRNPLSNANDSNHSVWNIEQPAANPPLCTNSNMIPNNNHSNLGFIRSAYIGLHEIIVFQKRTKSKSDRDPLVSNEFKEFHKLFHLGPLTSSSLLMENIGPLYLETISASQIWDKFPNQNGLKELMNSKKMHHFFLVKGWIDTFSDFREEDTFLINLKFKSSMNSSIVLKNKICSFSKTIVENDMKIDSSIFDGELYFALENVSMCSYLKKFLLRLKKCKDKPTMNSVLENVAILQTVHESENDEMILCVAYLFSVAERDCGAGGQSQYRLYSLVNN